MWFEIGEKPASCYVAQYALGHFNQLLGLFLLLAVLGFELRASP
jgi:hypothetical protein